MQVTALEERSGRRVHERGTTLLEIVITVAIMTIGMLGYFTLHIRAFQISGNAGTLTQAANLASGLQDMLLAIPFTEDLAGTSLYQECGALPTDPLSDLCARQDDVNAMGTDVSAQAALKFRRSYQINWLDATPKQVLVTVRVRYPAEDGRCPECTSTALKSGWKAVTTSTVRTVAAY